jgi:hypothetical protein
VDTLVDALRDACTPNEWSRGVELARDGAVVVEHRDEEELRVRVRTRRGLDAPLVTLWPDDPEWACECGMPRGEACEHVAAAALAVARGSAATPTSHGERRTGRIAYRFSSGADGLVLERFVRTDCGDVALKVGIAAAVDADEGTAITATPADREIEEAFGIFRSGPLPRVRAAKILAALAAADDVTLDGEPVACGAEPVLPVAVVEAVDGGHRVRLAPAPGLAKVFPGSGVALCGGALRPIGEAHLDPRELRDLTRGLVVPARRNAELVGELLPSLARRIPVDVERARLPGLERARPRVDFVVRDEKDALVVTPRLVYGDPPRAVVEEGRLVHLGGPVPLRDPDAERTIATRCRAALGVAPGASLEARDEEAVELAARLAREYDVASSVLRSFRVEGVLEPNVGAPGAAIDLAFVLPGDDATPSAAPRRAAAADVLDAWREGRSLVRLDGGGFARLPTGFLEAHGSTVAALIAARDPDGHVARAALPLAADLCEALGRGVPPEAARVREALAGDDDDAVAPPIDLRAELRGYQRDGLAWLTRLRRVGVGALLADDMGLGKTLQAIAALEGRTLVVAPASMLGVWADELRRFRPGLRVHTYHGRDRRLVDDADVTLTTYAILRLDARRLAGEEWSTLVLDEAQAIKNPRSRVSRAARGLRARWRVALTGTPIENHLDDLWSQMAVLNPGLLGEHATFVREVARPIEAGDAHAAARLRATVRPVVLRRVKRDVAPELPPRQETTLRCRLSAAERALYDAVRAAARRDVVARLAQGTSPLAALEALLRLRQAACHPALVPGRSASGSSKVDLLVDRLRLAAEDGHRSLVFSQWTGLLDLAQPTAEVAGLRTLRLDGSTRERAGVVRLFQADDGPDALFVSLKAGGVGLTLTAADHVFLLDPWWNPATEDQAADRAHRIGQTRPVLVHRLVAEDTVEERVLELQARKRHLAAAALEDGSAAAAGALTADEVVALLD